MDDVAADDIIVVGASAGGLVPLTALAADLPADLPAAVLVVMHMPETGGSNLAHILSKAGPLPAAPATSGERVRPGRIYVAVNDRHLLVKHDHLLLSAAPKQNRARPAVDTLFRSAARWYGPRTVGVVLSGALDDGAAGLAAIVAQGGDAVVQSPEDALVSGMPKAALAVVPDATVGPAARLGTEIAKLITHRGAVLEAPAPSTALIRETEMLETITVDGDGPVPGDPVALSCPDCTGGMRAIHTGAAVHYLCHVGHSWSPQALAAAQGEKIEHGLWTAVSMLEEQATVHRQLARQAAVAGNATTERHQRAAAEEVLRAAATIRKNFPDMLPPAMPVA